MAQYRLLDKTFINNTLREKGEIVDYDGQPGSTLQPVDTESKVDIPADWRDQNGLQRIALARSLGAPKQRLSAADADLWIENELANRDIAKDKSKAQDKAKPSITDGFLKSEPSTEPAADKPTSN